MASVALATSVSLELSEKSGIAGMRRNDRELEDKLRRACACLKTGRAPGDLRQRDFYDRFEAEEAAKARKSESHERTSIEQQAAIEEAQGNAIAELYEPTPPPVEPVPAELAGDARASRLRRDVRELARATGEKREELDMKSRAFQKELIQKYAAQDQLQATKQDCKKEQVKLRKAREMVNLQDRELEELRAALDEAQGFARTVASQMTLQSRSATQSSASQPPAVPLIAARPDPRETPSTSATTPQVDAIGRPSTSSKADRPRCHTADGASSSAAAVGAAIATPRPRAATTAAVSSDLTGQRSTHTAPARTAPATLSVEEMKGALLHSQDWKASASEAKLHGHLQKENEKLVDLIDAVGELGRQLRSPQRSGLKDASCALGAGDAVGSYYPHQKVDKARHIAAFSGIEMPKMARYAYTSVLANRPKHYSVYFV